jgi:hypothetical protein
VESEINRLKDRVFALESIIRFAAPDSPWGKAEWMSLAQTSIQQVKESSSKIEETLRYILRFKKEIDAFRDWQKTEKPAAFDYTKRDMKIVELRKNGMAIKDIAKDLGVTPARVGQICKRQRKIERQEQNSNATRGN